MKNRILYFYGRILGFKKCVYCENKYKLKIRKLNFPYWKYMIFLSSFFWNIYFRIFVITIIVWYIFKSFEK